MNKIRMRERKGNCGGPGVVVINSLSHYLGREGNLNLEKSLLHI